MSPTLPSHCERCDRRALRRRSILIVACPIILLLLTVVAPSASAQDPFLLSEPDSEERPPSRTSGEGDGAIQQTQAVGTPQLIPSEERRRRETSGSGLEGRFGHIAFPTFGRSDSITHLELFPYLRSGNNVWFSDLRSFLDNDGEFGGNFGLGVRHLDNSWDVIWGGNVFYDFDQTSGEPFHQIGFGLEAIGEVFGTRSNVYVPVGETSATFPHRVINQRFVDTGLVFDVLRPIGEAMTGGDIEFEAAVPGDWAKEHALRLFLGGYFFQDDDVPDITGAKFGVQALLFDHVATHSELTYDETFGTNATLGLTIYFPGGARDRNWNMSERRLTDFVRRNYNIIIDRRATYERDVVAMGAVSAAPLVIGHFSSVSAAPGIGEGPEVFDTLAGAMSIDPDIIFVHSGSVLTEGIVLSPGQVLLGEGVDHMVSVADYGDIMLPAVTTGSMRPTLLNVSGDAITLGEGSVVSGFVVQDPSGHGVVIDGSSSAGVFHTDIIGAGGNGLQVTNVSGNVTIDDVLIQDAAGIGLNVDNLSGSLTAGLTTINDSGIAALMIENSSGSAVFEELAITNTTAALGIDLLNNTGETDFESLVVTTNGGAGLQALAAGHVRVGGGEITSDNAAAVDIEDTDINLILDRIHSDGGAVGVRLVDTTGQFFLVGGPNFGSGGFIINKTTAILLENVESAFFNALDLDANGVGVHSSGSTAVGINAARIANTTGLAIDSLNDGFLQVSQSTFTDNGVGIGTIRYRVDTVDDYSLLLTGNSFDDADAATVIDVLAEAGAAGSNLGMEATGNQILHNLDNSVGIGVDWNGRVTLGAFGNQFLSEGDAARGLLINSTSTTDASILQVNSNSFLYTGNSIVATEMTVAGPLSLNYQNNLGLFSGSNTIGLEATLSEATTAAITQNQIEHQGGGGTSILFNEVAAGSSFAFEGNLFAFPDNGPIVERGIIFTNVTGSGTIDLFGSVDNRILGGTQPFFAPAGTTTGSILINGVDTP